VSKSSQKWWAAVKLDPERFNDWLIKQFRGEVTASERIVEFAEKYAPDDRSRRVLAVIASQERQHADWVLSLLQSRGLEPSIDGAEKRYWKETLPQITSFNDGCAVGAHAERMRLERIRTIASDESAPEDVRQTFSLILKDELFHEQAFREMAGQDALDATLSCHQCGMEVLGLEP